MKPISPFGLPFGISFTIWAIVGLIRWLQERFFKKRKRKISKVEISDIAAVVPAHNEELVIRRCIQALKQSLKPKQIYVISDGSRDKTYQYARLERVHVSKLSPGRGKAKALIYLIKRFRLYRRYKLIFIADADTFVDKNFVPNAIKVLKDPKMSVVFASSQIKWRQHILPRFSYYLLAYRDRLNRLLQYFFIYGQTWQYTNVNYVIPGFCTIYRSHILRKLEIDTPGLLIEDFNLAFQFHKKKLGKISFNHSLIGWDQYPDNLVDYWKQVRRWNIGFFQTVRKNGLWPSMFWASLALFSAEVLLHSIFILFIPALIIYLLVTNTTSSGPIINSFSSLYLQLGPFKNLSLVDLAINVFLIDYLLTVYIGLTHRKPQFVFYGIFFFFMHFLTSLILLSSIIPGFFGQSSGRWTSPKRQS